MQQLGPAPAAGESNSSCPDHPSGEGGGGETLKGNWGWQPLIPVALALKVGVSRAGTAASARARRDCGMQVQRIFSNL